MQVTHPFIYITVTSVQVALYISAGIPYVALKSVQLACIISAAKSLRPISSVFGTGMSLNNLVFGLSSFSILLDADGYRWFYTTGISHSVI